MDEGRVPCEAHAGDPTHGELTRGAPRSQSGGHGPNRCRGRRRTTTARPTPVQEVARSWGAADRAEYGERVLHHGHRARHPPPHRGARTCLMCIHPTIRTGVMPTRCDAISIPTAESMADFHHQSGNDSAERSPTYGPSTVSFTEAKRYLKPGDEAREKILVRWGRVVRGAFFTKKAIHTFFFSTFVVGLWISTCKTARTAVNSGFRISEHLDERHTSGALSKTQAAVQLQRGRVSTVHRARYIPVGPALRGPGKAPR